MANDAAVILNFPYEVKFNGIVLGFTSPDGVTLTLERNDIAVNVDQYGASVLKLLSAGENLRIQVTLMQFDVDLFKVAVPWGRVLRNGANERITFGRIPGRESTDYAKELILHRTTDAASLKTRDIKFFKAIVQEVGDIAANAANPLGIPITFLALIDTSKADGSLLGEIGTTAATSLVSS